MKKMFDFQNPWRFPGYHMPQEPYIRRHILAALLEHLSKPEITVLSGARQVGKTFLFKKMIEHLLTEKNTRPEQIFYFNFDALELIEIFTRPADFIEFISGYGVAQHKNYIFLDEFQRIPNGGLLLKNYYDLGLNFKFLVSGSASLEIKSQIKESLVGRKRLFELLPVSFKEYIAFQGLETTQPLALRARFESARYQKALENFIRFGGYPGIVKLTAENDKINLLKEIYDSYLKKDISDYFKVENVLGFNRLVQLLAAQTANLCNLNELAKMSGLTRYFTEIYLGHLQDTFVIRMLRPYFKNIGKSLVKTPKSYFVDPGIRNSIFSLFNPPEQRTDLGAIIENFVFSELIKKLPSDNLWFFRTQNDSEVDFLYQKGDEIIPIEVKYSKADKIPIPKILTSLAEMLPIQRAYVLTHSAYQDRKTEHFSVHFRPVWSIGEVVEAL